MLNTAFVIIAFVAIVIYFGASISATGNARNRSFFGTLRLLSGWWLYSPYEDDGDIPSKVNIVRTARIAWAIALVAIVGIVVT